MEESLGEGRPHSPSLPGHSRNLAVLYCYLRICRIYELYCTYILRFLCIRNKALKIYFCPQFQFSAPAAKLKGNIADPITCLSDFWLERKTGKGELFQYVNGKECKPANKRANGRGGEYLMEGCRYIAIGCVHRLENLPQTTL